MNAKDVLSKIALALSLTKEEVYLTYAKLADGTILESPTFDVGEAIDVVAEDGKTPAPDGEHEIILKDAEGIDEKIKIFVKDGMISERENVELPEGETQMDSMAGDDIASPEAPDAEVKEPMDIPQTLEKLSYRIEELEKMFSKLAEINPELIDSVKDAEQVKTEPLTESLSAIEPDEEDEDELPKLDGAPVEEDPTKLSKANFGKKVLNPQGTFLSKLYN